MKNLFLLLALFGFVFTACEGGESVEEENGGKPFAPKIELSQQSIEVEFEPDYYSINVTSPYSWRATSYDDWITVVSKTGVAGQEKLTFKPSRNVNEEERKGTIVLKNNDYDLVAELYIIQKPFVPFIECPNSLSLSNESGSSFFNITANFDYYFSYDVEWLKIDKYTDNKVKINFLKNDTFNERKANIIVYNGDYNIKRNIVVTQSALEPILSVDKTNLEFDANGGKQKVYISTNAEFKITWIGNWITCTKNKNSIDIEATPSTITNERTAEVTIHLLNCDIYQDIKVKQNAFVPKIEIEDVDPLLFDYTGGNKKIQIVSNIDYKVLSDAEWLSIEKVDNCINLIATSNDLFEKRTAEITIFSEKYNLSRSIKVLQNEFVLEFDIIGDSEININACKSRIIKHITANFEYQVSSDADWLLSKKVSGGVELIASKNVKTRERIANVNIYNDFYGISAILKVLQDKFVPEFEIGVSELLFSVGGGTQEIAITSNFEYEFFSNTDWITLEQNENNIKVTAQVNTGYDDRTAEIIILKDEYGLSKVVNILQNGITKDADKVMLYTAFSMITPSYNNVFDANIVSNTYKNGNGIIAFDAPLSSIGAYAFEGCDDLRSVKIPDSVTSIGNGAFRMCSCLSSVTIGNGVTEIGYDAFNSYLSVTSSLKEVYCKPTTPPTGGEYMFGLKRATIYVPRSSVQAYKTAEYWDYYSDYIVGYDFE